MKIEHLSHSQVETFINCPARYMFRYVKNIVIPPPSALVFGTATHKSIAANNVFKKEHGADEKLDVLQDIFVSAIKEEPEIKLDENENRDNLIDEGAQKIIPMYYKDLAPGCLPLMVEEWFEVEFPNVAWKFKGRIDLITQKEDVEDYKTTKRSPTTKPALLPDIQITSYALGYRAKTGHLPNRGRKHYLVRTKEPKIVTVPLGARSIKDLNVYLQLVSYVVECIEKEIFYPNIKNYQCNEDNCGYFPLCKREFSELNSGE